MTRKLMLFGVVVFAGCWNGDSEIQFHGTVCVAGKDHGVQVQYQITDSPWRLPFNGTSNPWHIHEGPCGETTGEKP